MFKPLAILAKAALVSALVCVQTHMQGLFCAEHFGVDLTDPPEPKVQQEQQNGSHQS